jgi:4-hydroxy-tetrahydrodipicolinate reductase
MNILVLGRGKTGSMVTEVARERHHHVSVLGANDNPKASALTAEKLAPINMVIDFTTPTAVLGNVEACMRAKKSIVIGTTGWYGELPRIRQMVEDPGCGIGLLHAANFSVGVNLFFEVVRSAAAALQHQYFGQIFERHHAQKKDAPSGTAITMQSILRESTENDLEITSFREGEMVGMHELVLDSPADTIYLCHTAKSRRGFAEGAVRAAEWLVGKKGIFDFKDVWREL